MTNVIDLPSFQAKKAVLFARVSSRDQEDGFSPEAQIFRLRQYCERRGLDVVRIFEITESSTRGDRKKFMEMIKFCRAQKQTIAIVADKVDRLQRSFKEYPLLNSLIEDGKIELHFNTENYIIHRNSVSQERLMWSFGVIMAQSYVDNLRDNVRRSFDHKVRAGEYLSRVPLGYLNIRSDRRGDVIVDDFRAPLIRKIFSEFSSGIYTLKRLTHDAAEWGLRTREGKNVSRSQLHQILNNPFYYGIMSIKGKSYSHRYPPLIEKHIFDKCQEVLEGWSKKAFKYGSKEFVFRGILLNKHDGKTLACYTKSKTYKNGGSGSWTYIKTFTSDRKPLLVREDKILAQAETALKSLVLPPDVINAIANHLKEFNRAEQSFLSRQSDELRKEEKRIEILLKGLMDLVIDKAITRDEYDSRRAELLIRKHKITTELNANQVGDDGFKDTMLLILDVISRAPQIFVEGTVSEKQKILNMVFANLSMDGRTFCSDYRFPFSCIVESVQNGKWLLVVDYLRTSVEERQKIFEFMDVFKNVIFTLLRKEIDKAHK